MCGSRDDAQVPKEIINILIDYIKKKISFLFYLVFFSRIHYNHTSQIIYSKLYLLIFTILKYIFYLSVVYKNLAYFCKLVQ